MLSLLDTWCCLLRGIEKGNYDLIVTHYFRICSWVFPLGYIEDNVLVDCGNLPGDFRSIHGMRLIFDVQKTKRVYLK